MADLPAITAGQFSVVEPHSHEGHTLPCGVDIVGGELIRPDANGYWVLADATTVANAAVDNLYFAGKDQQANLPLTGFRAPKLFDYGNALDALAPSDPLYLSDTPGALSTTVGTVTVQVGTVSPHWDDVTTMKKLVRSILP